MRLYVIPTFPKFTPAPLCFGGRSTDSASEQSRAAGEAQMFFEQTGVEDRNQ